MLRDHLPCEMDKGSFHDVLRYGGVMSTEGTLLSGVTRAISYDDSGVKASSLADALCGAVLGAIRGRSRVGCMVSGGIDSSLVLAALRKVTDGPIDAFTVAFPGGDGELQKASTVARSLGANHHVVPFDIPDILRRAEGWARVSPYGRFPYMAVLEEASKKGIEVLFSGEGGDEAFAGYAQRYSRMLKYKRFRSGRWLASPLAFLPGRYGRYMAILAHTGTFADFYAWWQSRIWIPARNEALEKWNGSDWMKAMMGFERTVRLVDYLSHLQCYSVASRIPLEFPLLDRAVESFSTPDNWRLMWDGSTMYGKYPLVEALKSMAPSEVVEIATRPKHGFSPPPMDLWWKEGLSKLHQETLASPLVELLPKELKDLEAGASRSKAMLYATALDAWCVGKFLEGSQGG